MASVFSGKAGRNASQITNKYATDQLAGLTSLYNTGTATAKRDILPTYPAAKNDLRSGYVQARSDLSGGRNVANDALMQGMTGANARLDTALANLNGLYGQGEATLGRAAAGYDPLIAEGMKGYGMYSNALGLNGAEGNAAARGAFQTGPGYEFQVEQATDAAQRAANRVGMTYSGNMMDQTARIGQGLAAGEWNNWLGHLQGYQGAAGNAVAGQAGVLNNLASMYQNQGNAGAAITGQQAQNQMAAGQGVSANDMTAGAGLAGLSSQYGSDQANLMLNRGQSLANIDLANMNNQAGAQNNYWNTVIQSTQQGMMAGQQAAQNRMGAIMGGIQMAGQAVGAMAGMPVSGGGSVGGNFLSKIFG